MQARFDYVSAASSTNLEFILNCAMSIDNTLLAISIYVNFVRKLKFFTKRIEALNAH